MKKVRARSNEEIAALNKSPIMKTIDKANKVISKIHMLEFELLDIFKESGLSKKDIEKCISFLNKADKNLMDLDSYFVTLIRRWKYEPKV